MIILVSFAFLAGIVTVLSPCILPILPIILSSTIGGRRMGKSRPFGVVVGFILSFTFFTLFLSTIVRFSGISADALRVVSVVVIGGFGLSLLIPKFQLVVEQLFSKLSSLMPSNQGKTGFSGGLLIGISVGLLWTPCVGPILASVISLAITGTVTFDAFLITFTYALGTAIPMFLILLGGQNTLTRVPWLLSNLGRIQKIFGLLMILTAIGIFFNFDRKFQTFILQKFPNYGVGLIKLEENSLVKEQLQRKSDQKIQKEEMGKTAFDMNLPKGPKAPELIPGGKWFNGDPTTLEKLKGKVILIDFWTYTCINCQRTFPYLRTWYEKYADKGLVIIGVHSPEFEFEKNERNVSQAIKDFNLPYLVVQDNDFATWRAYNNQYWPAKYLIDKDGYVRYTHFGEGEYDTTEKAIQELLQEAGAKDVTSNINNDKYEVYSRTPELYLGYGRLNYFGSPESIKRDKLEKYSSPATLEDNHLAYVGNWFVMNEYANPQKGAKLLLNFNSKEVYLVMRSKDGKPAKIKVIIDGKTQAFGEDNEEGFVIVDKDRLYKLINLDAPGQHILQLEFEDNNVELFAFTFG